METNLAQSIIFQQKNGDYWQTATCIPKKLNVNDGTEYTIII